MAVLWRPQDFFENLHHPGIVKPGKGFIKNNDLGIHREDPGDCQFSLFPA